MHIKLGGAQPSTRLTMRILFPNISGSWAKIKSKLVTKMILKSGIAELRMMETDNKHSQLSKIVREGVEHHHINICPCTKACRNIHGLNVVDEQDVENIGLIPHQMSEI